MNTCRTAERAALPLASVPIPIHKLLIPPLSSRTLSCTSMTQLWWLLPIFTLAHPCWWLSHWISIVYGTQINKESLLKDSFSRAPLVLCGLYLRHWHGKHRLTPCCYKKWGESAEDHFTHPHTNKSCFPEMFWAVGKILMGLSVLSQVLWRPVPFRGDSWEWTQLCLASTNGPRKAHKAIELSCWSLLFAQQCFKWHFPVWVSWKLLGNAAPSWILLPCRLEVTECFCHRKREKGRWERWDEAKRRKALEDWGFET